MSILPPRRKRVAFIMPPDMLDDDDDPSIQPIRDVAHLSVPDTQVVPQREIATARIPNEDLPAQQTPVTSYWSMTDSQLRQKIVKMTRNQLEHAFIKLSRSHQPSYEQMTSILNGLDLTPLSVPLKKPVRSLDDQVYDFGVQLREYDTEKDVVRATQCGEKCMDIIKNILAEVLGDVRGSLQGKKLDLDERYQLWLNRLDALFNLVDLLGECITTVDRTCWAAHMVVEVGSAMVTFAAASTNAGLAMTLMQSRQVTEMTTSLNTCVEELKEHIRKLEGEGEELDDLGTAYTVDPTSHGEDEPQMPFTTENVNRLLRDDNYRDQEQQTPSDSPSHYQDHHSVVSDDLTTEGEIFRPAAMARWAGLDWNGGNHDDDDYSDDERLSYNSDYESPWH
jgi:hypothetical protein